MRRRGEPTWQERVEKLTARELEVAYLIRRELAQKQIAEVLGISANTVGEHRKSLYVKLGIHSAAGLSRLREERELGLAIDARVRVLFVRRSPVSAP
jgi:DNA-binding CsgD family transcriptional regulator